MFITASFPFILTVVIYSCSIHPYYKVSLAAIKNHHGQSFLYRPSKLDQMVRLQQGITPHGLEGGRGAL